jgi:CRP/FNR family transcriptional regulator, dissimilatory nitrate respiration regulator
MINIMFEDLEPLLTSIVRRELAFNSGQTVFHQGDPVRQVFFVTDGMVHLIRHLASGAPLVLQRARSGTILAEASLYSAKYHCDATAVTGATAWAISKKELLNRLAQSPKLGMAFIRRLANELQLARFQAEVLSIRRVAARLDAWIEWNGEVPPKGEWVSLAAELAVSPEALYREMSRRRL